MGCDPSPRFPPFPLGRVIYECMHAGLASVAGKLRGFFLSFRSQKMARGICQLAQRIANLSRGNSQGTYIWADALGNAGESLGVPTSSTPLPAKDNAATYLKFFNNTFEIASLPCAARHALAGTGGIKTRQDSRKRIANQLRD